MPGASARTPLAHKSTRLSIFFLVPLAFLIGGCAKGKKAGPPAPEGMRLIAGGTFQMGSKNAVRPDELPVHNVTVSAFYMDKTEVTQADYLALMGVNPSHFTGDPKRPVENVTWFDAVLYCNARSRRDGLEEVYSFSGVSGTVGNGCTGLGSLNVNPLRNGYRLPTEAEWEYACRAGSSVDFYWGAIWPLETKADTTVIDAHAVWLHNSNNTTARVRTKRPNGLGLYDMGGNVAEWCHDWYDGRYYSESPSADPPGALPSVARVVRGGSWVNDAIYLRSACRSMFLPGDRDLSVGFRCVRRAN